MAFADQDLDPDYEIDDEDGDGSDDWPDDEEDPFALGCRFPDECCMPGEHMLCECVTVEMMADDIDNGGAP